MVPISIKEFVKQYERRNKLFNDHEMTESLKKVAKIRDRGATCRICGSLIWAIGSAIIGWNGCFTCITGEVDDSDDYEVYLSSRNNGKN